MFTDPQTSSFYLWTWIPVVLTALVLGNSYQLKAQTFIENLTVETYYIANDDDSNSPTSDGIIQGTVAYRLYLNLCTGCKLQSIFGSPVHPIEITSSDNFYNSSFGSQFGHSINGNTLTILDGAVLDSYLTFGGASSLHLGILKTDDNNGSIWQNRTPPQPLTNNSAEVGIPLTMQDGLIISGNSTTIPINFQTNTDAEFISAFGTGTLTNSFVSTIFSASAPSGVSGTGTENEIQIAQISTMGDLAFRLNIRILDAGGVLRTIVSEDPESGENQSNFLSYPPECGCTDPDFIEFDALAQCDDGSCANLVVFGCLNEAACNYNPEANFGIPELCCFVDSCQGLDISVLCPTLDIFVGAGRQNLFVYPNPSNDFIHVKGDFIAPELERIQAIDQNGRVIASFGPDVFVGENEMQLSISGLMPGTYILLIQTKKSTMTSLFQKL